MPKTSSNSKKTASVKQTASKSKSTDKKEDASSVPSQKTSHTSRNIWYVVAILILVIALVASIMTRDKNTSENTSNHAEYSQNSSDNEESTTVPVVQAQATVDEQRDAIDSYLQNPYDPETVDLAGFNGDRIKRGAKFKITIEYSNAGDSNWAEGFVKITHGDGLELLTDSISDEFGSKKTQIDPSRYNASTRTLDYGPGTANSATSEVNAGQAGRVTFVVSAKEDAQIGSKQRIISYLTGENEKIGNIDVYYLEITE